MSHYEFIVAIIGSIIGSSGLTAILTTVFSRKKYTEEGKKMQQDREINLDKYVNDKLKEVTEMYRSETKELKDSNIALQAQVTDLQNKIQALMSWIVNDNYATQTFLIAKIKELDPEFEIPETAPFPNPYQIDASSQQQ